MTSAKQLMMEIDVLNQIRQHQQADVKQHKQYWLALYQHHGWAVVTTVSSAFLIGWSVPRLLRGAKGFKILGRLFPFVISMAQLRQAFPVIK